MEEPTETDVLRTGTGFWLTHNRHLTGTKLGPWCTVTDHDKKRADLVDAYRVNKNIDAPPGSEGVVLSGKIAQPESIRNYLMLTGRISSDQAGEFDLGNLLHTSSFWISDRLTFPGPLPLAGIDQLRDKSPGWELRNERWRSLLNTYAASPWISVSPPGTVVAGGLRGALLVKTIFKQVEFSDKGGPRVDRLVHPTIDTWVQAILCLVCDHTISFVEIAMVNADWIWSWRLERDNAGLEAFKLAIAPAAADWRQMQSAVDDLHAHDETTRRMATREVKKPLLREVAENVRKAVNAYKMETMRVRKVFEDENGIAFRWAKRDASGTCIDAVQNTDAIITHPSQEFANRRNYSPFWVYAKTDRGNMYVPTRTPKEASEDTPSVRLMTAQPRFAFLEMARVV